MARKPGPYFSVDIGGGRSAPFYALRFDKKGRSESPLTQQHLTDALRSGNYTDVYVFSHGWNNEWEIALDRYKAFIGQYRALRDTYGLSFDRPYQPLLAGIFWPSAILTAPWDGGPKFAADDDADDEAYAIDVSLLQDFVEDVAPSDATRFYELAEKESVEKDEARELLRIVSPSLDGGDPDLDADPARDVDDLLVAWAMLDVELNPPEPRGSLDDFGSAVPSRSFEPHAAGSVGKLSPRNLFRGMTARRMKDRAGVVGANGVGPALRSMLDVTVAGDTRFHLIGHSYGARLLLTAVGRPAGGGLPREVDSLLLLQPAVNHLCFADRLPNGRAGGLRGALAKVKQPILSTFSRHDFPLRRMFHVALHRGKDLGEAEIAADGPPSEYAALGGYGPRGLAHWKEVPIKDPTDTYDLTETAPRIWAVNGERTISGHSDVINESTAWALFSLARS